MERKKFVPWLFFVILNLFMTVAMFVISLKWHKDIIGKLLIVAGPPIIISIIVWGVLQYALSSEDYNLIAGYNEKNNYNKKELRRVISYIQGYVIIISFISNFTIFIMSFFPKYVELYKYVLYIYIFNFFVGIIAINIKKKNELYIK